MPIVFTRTAGSMALQKFAYLVICLAVSAAFVVAIVFAEQASLFIKLVLGLAVLIGAALSLKIGREIVAVLGSGEAWYVEISDQRLTWYSPLPAQMKSFEVALSDIEEATKTLVQYRNSNRTPKTEFAINQADGNVIKIDPQTSGINPVKVFAALEQKGINVLSLHRKEGKKVRVTVGQFAT